MTITREQFMAAFQVGPGSPSDPTSAGQSKGSAVAMAKAKLDWNQAKNTVRSQLAPLREDILAEFQEPELVAAANKLEKVLDGFDAGLGDTLDEIYGAGEPAVQDELSSKAGQIAQDYLSFLASNPLIAHLDKNPFVPLDIKGALSAPLQNLLSKL